MIFELGLARAHFARATFACKILDMFQRELRDCTRALLLYLKVAILEPKAWECTSRTTSVLKKVTICHPEQRECSSRAACMLETCVLSRSCGNAFRVLLLYSKLAILHPELSCSSRGGCGTWNLRFQPELRECTSRTTFVPKTCDFAARTAAAQFPHNILVLETCCS